MFNSLESRQEKETAHSGDTWTKKLQTLNRMRLVAGSGLGLELQLPLRVPPRAETRSQDQAPDFVAMVQQLASQAAAATAGILRTQTARDVTQLIC